jgi:hypothetical protein
VNVLRELSPFVSVAQEVTQHSSHRTNHLNWDMPPRANYLRIASQQP